MEIGWHICQDEERRLSTELENMLDVMTSAEEQEEEEAGQSSSKKSNFYNKNAAEALLEISL